MMGARLSVPEDGPGISAAMTKCIPNVNLPAATPGPRVVIIGGGFSGCTAAVQLVRASAGPVNVTIVEPKARLGRGLAYSATDPDHRLNAPTFVHSLIPEDAWHFHRWVLA